MKILVSASKDFEEYDFAQFNGKRKLSVPAGAKTLTLEPGVIFGYREGKNAVYVVVPSTGLNKEYKVSEDDFDKKIGPKADNARKPSAKKAFAAPKAEEKPAKKDAKPAKKDAKATKEYAKAERAKRKGESDLGLISDAILGKKAKAAPKKAAVDPESIDRDFNVPLSRIDPRAFSREEYDAFPALGQWFNTGRRGPSSRAAVVTLARFRNKPHVISYFKRSGDEQYLFMPVAKLGWPYAEKLEQRYGARKAGPRMTYEEFVAARQAVRDFELRLNDRENKRADEGREIAQRLNIDRKSVGKLALINWSKGFPSWKRIEDVQADKQKIGIRGSGSKLRWIPFSFILDLKAPI